MYAILRKDSMEYVKGVRMFGSFAAVIWNSDKSQAMQNSKKFMQDLADNINMNYPEYNARVVRA